MKPALVALFTLLTTAAPLAQGLHDAVPDCRHGRVTLRKCHEDCTKLAARPVRPDRLALRIEQIRQCDNRCWGIEAALDECAFRRLR